MKLEGNIAVITGSGSGIGKSCALAFAAEGATVIVADIHRQAAESVAGLIIEQGGKAIPMEVDVAVPASVTALAERVVSICGKVDTLLNNAAVQVNKPVPETTFEEWNRQWAVNVGGVFLCAKYFMPHLVKSSGSIVNMSSVNGYYAEPDCAGYCATKGAIISLTKAMAIDHGPAGVRVNCICPGYIDAGLAEGYFQSRPDPAKARRDAGKLHALWRIGRPEEVAQVAVFLASREASFVTGAAYVVDGGFGSGLPRP